MTEPDLSHHLVDVLVRVLPEAAALSGGLRRDTELSSVGLDSLRTLQLLLELDRVFGVTLPDDVVASDRLSTAGAVQDAVQEALAAGAQPR